MMAFGPTEWLLLGALIALHVAFCVRVARHVGRIGRSRGRWFLITFFLSAAPAAVLLWREFQRRRGSANPPRQADPTARCRHCSGLLPPQDADAAEQPRLCPHCGHRLNEEYLA